MKKNIYKRTIFCWCLLLVVTLSISYFYYKTERKKSKVKVKPTHIENVFRKKNKLDKSQAIIVKYIMNNSMWVGRTQVGVPKSVAKEIVNEAYKTPRPKLIIAIIAVESHFNPFAVSNAYSIGLGQINFKVHQKELVKNKIINDTSDLFEISKNIKAIEFILNEKLKLTHGNLQKAVGLYFGDCKQNKKYIEKVYTQLGKIELNNEGVEK